MKRIKRITVVVIMCLCINIFSLLVLAENTFEESAEKEVISAFEEIILSNSHIKQELEGMEITEDQTVPCNVTIEDDFSDNLIIVYIKKEYSAIQQTYTVDDFSYIQLSHIQPVFEYIPEENNRIGLFLYLKYSGKQNVLDAIELLLQDEKIYLAYPDMIYFAEFESENSTLDSSSVGCETPINTLSGICCAHKYTNSFMGYDASSAAAPIKIGIIDTGVCQGMPFDNKVFSSVRFKKNNNNNQVTMISGYENPIDMHGTNIASIIAKPAENISDKHNGVCDNSLHEGVCPNVQIYDLKVFHMYDGVARFYLSCITEAINYARTVGIKILNMSLSTKDLADYKVAFDTAVNQFDGLIITSAGNDGDDNDDDTEFVDSNPHDEIDTTLQYPRGSSSEKIIVVGDAEFGAEGTVKRDRSAFGKNTVDLFAYGTTYGYVCYDENNNTEFDNNFTQWDGNISSITRAEKTGTSYAAARVSGAAAVLWDICRDLTPAQVKNYLLEGVDIHSGLADACVTGGTLNVYKSAKLLISDLAYSGQTIFAGHFTDEDSLQVAAYTRTKSTQLKCYVWTFDQSTKSFSDPELLVTNDYYALSDNNKYRSASGDFDGDGIDEIATLYDWNDRLFMQGKDFSGHPCYINLPVENFTGRVTSGDFDGDGKDELAAFYEMPDVWAHTKLYVWDFTGTKSGMVATQKVLYDSGAGNYVADYITDKVVSGDFDGDGNDEVGAVYYYSSTGKYSLHKFDINISGNTATHTNLIFGKTDVDASKIDGRVVACNYDGGGDDEIVCLYDNSEVSAGGIINYGFRFTPVANSWQATPLYTSSANEYVASRSKYLMVSDDFTDTDSKYPDGLDDIVTFYKLPSETLARGKLYYSLAPNLAGYTSAWDPLS